MTGSHLEDLMKRKSDLRSVNDYSSAESLRSALLSMEGQRQQPNLNVTSQHHPQSSWGNTGIVEQRAEPKAAVDMRKIDGVVPLLQLTANNKIASSSGRRNITPGSPSDKENAIKVELQQELRRLALLKSYRVIGSCKNPAYERLVSLASRIFDAPIAYVSVLDISKQHFLAARGMGGASPMGNDDTPEEHHQDDSICSHLVHSDQDILVVPDLLQDDRFKDHENVKGGPQLRFCAASPLTCPEGLRLGCICVLDTKPHPEGLSLDMKQNLREIADMVMDVMVEEREQMIFERRQPSQMIACISNDLMTPLLGIVQGLSTLRDDEELANSLSTQQKEIFNTAFACSTVMTRICQKSLKSFRKQQKSNAKTPFGGGDDAKDMLILQDLVKHLYVVMDPFPKRVPLVVTVFDTVPPVIVADDLKVFRSIVNFLTNACANTETGSVHLKIYLQDEAVDKETSSENECQKSIVFLVEDTGCGVSVDQYQQLFKPMHTNTGDSGCPCTLASFGDKTTKSTKTGLGLYSVATQIASMGGSYGFRPRGFDENGMQLHDDSGLELKGSIFWFSIPLTLPTGHAIPPDHDAQLSIVESDEDDEDDDTTHDKRKWNADDEAALDQDFTHSLSVGEKRRLKAFVGEPSKSRRKKALVIDDSLVIRRTMSRMLERLGFEVTEAVNGLEGLNQLQENLFDLILCDFLMPVMDGCECVQQYRQFEIASRPWFDQYIVGMSAHADEGDVDRGLKVGMNDYRPKPVTMRHLEEIIEGQEFKYASTRLHSIFDDSPITDDESTKHFKTTGINSSNADDPHYMGEQTLNVCLVMEGGDAISSIARKVTEGNGWKVVVVHNGEAALRLLQMRNWDAVLIDDALPGLSSCTVMENFRAWEKINRVNRQKSVYQVNSSFIPSHLETSSTVQLPSGFDGALGKPVSAKTLQEFLRRSMEGKTCMSHDIVQR